MPAFPENLRRHVAGRAAGGREDRELGVVDDAGQPKVGDQQVSILVGAAEEEVLGLQICEEQETSGKLLGRRLDR